MFDLVLQDVGGAGVPVPLPGRGLVFLGADGLMRAKLHDASIVGAGAVAGTGSTGAALLAFANKWLGVWTVSPVGACLQFNMAGIFANGGALDFFIQGKNVHGTAAANLIVEIKIGGVVACAVKVALGTTARPGRSWCASGKIVVTSEGGRFSSLSAAVDFVPQDADSHAGEFAAVSMGMGTYVEIYARLSTAAAGSSLSLLGGYAVKVV